MAFDNVIFDGKTLADLFSDVYKNTEAKRAQINQFVASMVKLIRTPEDAAVLGPVVKDFLEVNVKNDEHIVRLVQIAQRLVSVNSKSASTELLSEEEKNQLLNNIKSDFDAVLAEQDELDNTITQLRK
jgi:hypothetical protein